MVHYLDTSGNSIHPDILLTGTIGERFTSEQKEIEGYLFNKVIGEPTGDFTNQPQTITYLYHKKN
ncbi:MucBP domain-containing protein [Carnobacterium maltaromaticum]|uniref:MucBP domain-containing protein n=1 Tax=Carnobacterium maltaromaticum TaxID=2751 RepID=UPI0012F955CA|nr:MucBP domain-containing protein [Carnobacterium maltaromaticum]